ncbi:MBL fold metallo-hydrolase [Paraburkholderia sacchari]|uniref:MBL fold metallo-hydrolase n=1 Tax=Paraburkholderia sacchari TaxID=159450 RepID=UPI001BCAA736|nr:MBL fold metallo-hydrolase [Paraburkholderia sacchari]
MSGVAYPCGDAPPAGAAREVAPGVLWIRMPMPGALDHINLWAVRDGDGWALVDTGLRTEATTLAWQTLLGERGGLGEGGLTRIFVTHMHPDHVGMAGWLAVRGACRLWMTRLEYLMCRVLAADTGREAPQDALDFYRRAGWSDSALETYRARFGGFGRYMHAMPDSYRRLHDGETLRIGGHAWRVVVGTGHSPEHACFYCEALKLFISGDQVLPRISSNVSVFPREPEANPMQDWLDSLAQLQRVIPDDVLVLPAHNEPFHGLHARLRHLEKGQLRALERLREALRVPRRAVDVFEQLFARTIGDDPHLLNMATGESIAHLNYLLASGEAVMETSADGVAWYRLADAAARP